MRLQHMSSFRQRLLGLHACQQPSGQDGIWLQPCKAIHTLFLPYAIDVLFLDAQYRVLRCCHSLPPNRMAWHWNAASVIELGSGYCRRHPDYALRARAAAMRIKPLNPGRFRRWRDRWRRTR